MKGALTLLLIVAGTAIVGRQTPPDDVPGAGPFSVEPRAKRPAIGETPWVPTTVYSGQAGTVRPPGADYALRFVQPDETGDLERWTVLLERQGSAPVRLTGSDPSAFAYVSPDGRYIFLEPLFVVDTKTWRRYALHDTFGIHPYISLVAVTRDGERLFLQRRDCAYDCPNDVPEEYFELTFPR